MSPIFEIDAPAKINLILRVLAQEASGFHALETVFCAISLADTVRVQRGGGEIDLRVEGAIDTGPARDNLVVRAARSFYLELGGMETGVRIELRKRIPAEAGLGGGSSDAAATLLALNALHDAPLSPEMLLHLGSGLGSDVPFFLGGSPLALGWSRGERLLALPPLPPRPLLVAHPGVGISTGAAFQRIAELRGGSYEPRANRLTLAQLSSWNRLAELADNDFQQPAEEEIPTLRSGLARMRRAGADLALLAGSGSAIFGIFPDPDARDRAALDLRADGFAVWSAETLSSLPLPHQIGAPHR